METPRANKVQALHKGYLKELKKVKEALRDDPNDVELSLRAYRLEGLLINMERTNAFYNALAEDIEAHVPEARVEIIEPDECPETERYDQEQYQLQLQSNLQ